MTTEDAKSTSQGNNPASTERLHLVLKLGRKLKFTDHKSNSLTIERVSSNLISGHIRRFSDSCTILLAIKANISNLNAPLVVH